MPEMVERIAKALAWAERVEVDDEHRMMARAAMEAMRGATHGAQKTGAAHGQDMVEVAASQMVGDADKSDIVNRLRAHVSDRGGASLQNGAWQMMLQAADEIDELRALAGSLNRDYGKVLRENVALKAK